MLIEKIVSVLSDSPRAFMTLKDWVLRWEGTFPKFFILLSLVAQHLSLLHWGLKSTITKRIRFWYRPEQPNCHYFWWQIVQIKVSRSVLAKYVPLHDFTSYSTYQYFLLLQFSLSLWCNLTFSYRESSNLKTLPFMWHRMQSTSSHLPLHG